MDSKSIENVLITVVDETLCADVIADPVGKIEIS